MAVETRTKYRASIGWLVADNIASLLINYFPGVSALLWAHVHQCRHGVSTASWETTAPPGGLLDRTAQWQEDADWLATSHLPHNVSQHLPRLRWTPTQRQSEGEAVLPPSHATLHQRRRCQVSSLPFTRTTGWALGHYGIWHEGTIL